MRRLVPVLCVAIGMLFASSSSAWAIPATNPDISVLTRDAGESALVTFSTPIDSVVGATVMCMPASNSAFAAGTTTVSCMGTNFGGAPVCPDPMNPAVCFPGGIPTPTGTSTFKVTVAQDTVAPTLSPISPKSATAAAGATGAVVTYDLPTVTDNATSPSAATCIPASGSTFPIGTSTVGCFAADRFGRIGTSTFDVVVAGTPVVDTTKDQEGADTPRVLTALVALFGRDTTTRAAVQKSGVTVEGMCSIDCKVTTSLFVSPKQLGRRGTKPVLLGQSAWSIKGSATGTATVKLSKVGASAVAASAGRRLTVSVRSVVSAEGVKVTRLLDRTLVVS